MKLESDRPQLSRRSLLAGLSTLVLGFTSVFASARNSRLARRFDTRYELLVNLEVPVQDGFRVRRPYVAVWLEDMDGKAVRTLSLWIQLVKKGPKYIPDLRRWFRDEESRKQADGGDLIVTSSSPTREAGKYSVVWDGKNDKGKLVDQGDYVLCIEAARQHGTYQLITQKFGIGTRPFLANLPENIEIKGATVEFRRRS